MLFAYFVLLLICCSWAYEGYGFRMTGHVTPVGMGMNLLWLGLWIWKVFYRYELILRRDELEIVTIGLWRQSHYIVDLTQTESFARKYRHDFSGGRASDTTSTGTTWPMKTRPVSWRSAKERAWPRSFSAAATNFCVSWSASCRTSTSNFNSVWEGSIQECS